MKLFHPHNTYVLDIAKEEYITGNPEKPGILLIHGFTGSPYELRYLAHRLASNGFTVHLIRLPGHGTNGDDFLLSSAEQWFRRVIDGYLALKSVTPEVYVAGLSMGGLLTLQLASIFPIPRIALAAPALVITRKHFTLTPLLSKFIKRKAKKYVPDPNDSPELQELRGKYECYTWVKPAAELRKMQLNTIRLLPRVKSKTLMIVSKGDQTVPPIAASLLKTRIKAEEVQTIILEKSSHLITNDCEKERVADEIIRFFT